MKTVSQEIKETLEGDIEMALHQAASALCLAIGMRETARKYPRALYKLNATIEDLERAEALLKSALGRTKGDSE